jgi:hypothetical protein
MDLFGSVMFADSTGDTIPIMYLELLRDLQKPSRYNLGGAVLAHLYSNLCHGCKVSMLFLSYFNYLPCHALTVLF